MKFTSSTVGLYVHIPYCQQKCPYCAFYSVPIDAAEPHVLVDALFTELDFYNVSEPVQTIYIGGGSPSCLPRELLVEMVVSLTSQFKDTDELTFECNPAQADPGMLKILRTLGVNRLSIGAQSFHADELTTLGRIHQPQQTAEAVRMARAAGFENIGLDLIFSVPGSTMESWTYSLKSAVALDVQHISAYSLTIEEGTPFGRAVRHGQLSLVDEQTDRGMYERTRQILKDAGFVQYEISNFAKPGFQCRHNIRYWKNQTVIGIGPAAAGWYNGKRTTNIANVQTYLEQIKNNRFAYTEEGTPTPEQVAGETAVLGLRMAEGIDLHEYQKQTGFDLLTLFRDVIQQHCTNGLLECTNTHCRLTEKGLSYADTVASDFVL